MTGSRELADRHAAACARFTAAVHAVEDRWDVPTPCDEWDARGLLEHVIGFHDVLLLRPLDAKPDRPRDDPERRWISTQKALSVLMTQPGVLDGPIDVPAVGESPATQVDAPRLLGVLTMDVLVHAWDLARAVGADDRLDPDLCALAVERLPDDGSLAASGMFAPSVPLDAHADAQTQLLARTGRDPAWSPPAR